MQADNIAPVYMFKNPQTKGKYRYSNKGQAVGFNYKCIAFYGPT